MTTEVPAADRLPRLGVVWDFGAASPMNILASARGLATVVFLCDRGLPAVRGVVDELRALAGVCQLWDITGLSDQQIVDQPGFADLAGITTFAETQLTRTAALAARRALPFLTPQAAAAVTDKYLQRQLLARAGIQHTRCARLRAGTGLRGPGSDALDADVRAALDVVGLPAVLKPRTGAASAYTCRVDTVTAASAWAQEFLAGRPGREFVVEELLRGDPSVAGPEWGDYVSVESVTSGGQTRHLEITGKFPLADPFRETGYVLPSTISAPVAQEVLELTGAAIRAVGIRDGASHVEVKLTPAGPRIIEVNGRLGGYVADLLRRARGYDLVRAALGAALGRPCAPLVPGPARRYAFQYFLNPPADAVELLRLDGTEGLLRHRGIQLVEAVKAVGDRIDWRHGTLAYVAIVHGSGRDHGDVLRLADLARRTVAVEYRLAPPTTPPKSLKNV